MEAYSRDLLRGFGGGNDGDQKVQRLDSRTEEMDLSLGLSLGVRFTAERRSGEGNGAEVQPTATSLDSIIKEEPAAELRASLCPSDGQGTPSANGWSLSSAVVSSSQGTNGVHQAEGANSTIMATRGSGGGQQDGSERSKVREMPLVWTNGLPNCRRTIGLLYEYSKVDEVRILCMCHRSLLTPAEFVEHAGGGQVANPLRSILVKPPPWVESSAAQVFRVWPQR